MSRTKPALVMTLAAIAKLGALDVETVVVSWIRRP
jgi:hypothetical protein